MEDHFESVADGSGTQHPAAEVATPARLRKGLEEALSEAEELVRRSGNPRARMSSVERGTGGINSPDQLRQQVQAGPAPFWEAVGS